MPNMWSLTPESYSSLAANELPFVIADMVPGASDPDIAVPFMAACEQVAKEYYAQFQRTPDMLIAKEKELLVKKTALSSVRDSIELLESSILTFKGARLREAYHSLFELADKRAELESEVWELDRVLFMLKSQSFA